MFDNLQKRLSSAMSKIRGLTRLSEKEIDQVLAEIRTGLLEGDVHFRVTKDFLARVKERCLRDEVIKSLTPQQQVLRVLHEELTLVLGEKNRELSFASTPPSVLFVCGLQGSGKTTTISKLALYLKTQGKRVGVTSVDIYRPAAIDQLKALAERVEIPFVGIGGDDLKTAPRDRAQQALRAARDANLEVLLLDTAGRLQIDDELMEELAGLHRELNPTEVLLVVDSMMGQQAVEVAEGFEKKIPLTGFVLTKLDGDTRGGAALSLVSVIGKPIKFLGTGERPTDFEAFHPDRLASRLLDMGDVLSLLEKAEQVISQEEATAAAEKLRKSDFTLEDFRDQLQMVTRMGPVSNLLKMLPGMGGLKDQLDSQDVEKELKKVNAILNSMTPGERHAPDILNGSRRARIAKGSGTEVSDVNSLVKRFLDARKMMKQLGKMGNLFKGMGGPGPEGLSGAKKTPTSSQMHSNPLFRKSPGRGFGRKL